MKILFLYNNIHIKMCKFNSIFYACFFFKTTNIHIYNNATFIINISHEQLKL